MVAMPLYRVGVFIGLDIGGRDRSVTVSVGKLVTGAPPPRSRLWSAVQMIDRPNRQRGCTSQYGIAKTSPITSACREQWGWRDQVIADIRSRPKQRRPV